MADGEEATIRNSEVVEDQPDKAEEQEEETKQAAEGAEEAIERPTQHFG